MTTHKLSSLYSESNYSVVLINSKKGLTHKLMRNQESIRKVGEVIQARYLITGQLYNNSKVNQTQNTKLSHPSTHAHNYNKQT